MVDLNKRSTQSRIRICEEMLCHVRYATWPSAHQITNYQQKEKNRGKSNGEIDENDRDV